MKLQITPLAVNDLEDIADYIAEDSHKRARSFVAELRSKFKQIARNPEGFRSRVNWASTFALVRTEST